MSGDYITGSHKLGRPGTHDGSRDGRVTRDG